MDLTGIGILLVGIAFLVLAICIARILNKLSAILEGVNQTVAQLPKQLDDVLDETGKLIHNSNDTLSDVNEKLGTLTPLFHIVGDVGESTRNLSSSLVNVTKTVRKKAGQADEEVQHKRLGGIYGTTALGYYLFKRRKEIKKEQEV